MQPRNVLKSSRLRYPPSVSIVLYYVVSSLNWLMCSFMEVLLGFPVVYSARTFTSIASAMSESRLGSSIQAMSALYATRPSASSSVSLSGLNLLMIWDTTVPWWLL